MKYFKLKDLNIENSFKKLKLSEAYLWKIQQTDDYKILMNFHSYFPLIESRIYKDIAKSHLNIIDLCRILTKDKSIISEYSEMIDRIEEKLYDQADRLWYIALVKG